MANLHEENEPRDGDPWDFYCAVCHCSIYCYDDNCPCDCHGEPDEDE